MLMLMPLLMPLPAGADWAAWTGLDLAPSQAGGELPLQLPSSKTRQDKTDERQRGRVQSGSGIAQTEDGSQKESKTQTKGSPCSEKKGASADARPQAW